MKRTLLIAAGLGAALLTGCIVTAVYPFYTAKDEVSDPALAGVWKDAGGGNAGKDFWEFARFGPKGYLLATVENDQTNSYEAHLFRLKQHSFLDLCPTNRVENHLPLHYLFQAEVTTNSLRVRSFDLDWLSKLLEKDPKALRHIQVPNEPGDTNKLDLVLTADTAELQDFILKHIADTNAFTGSTELKR